MNENWNAYLSMSWTSEDDECEAACGVVMGPDRYVEGHLGHYCSTKCRNDSESGGYVDDQRWEARQMGLTAL